MLYLGTPSGPDVKRVMEAGDLGCMTTPRQGNLIPHGALIGVDNGCFGARYVGDEKWYEFLARTVEQYGNDRILFAVAPDVPFDAAGTLAKSLPWLSKIRDLGVRAAFAAQDGCDELGIPWDAFDCLFIAGSTEWKIGPVAERLAREAKQRGKWVHMGRVNTRQRLRIAERFGCDSCDGTTLARGPDRNLPSLMRWLDELHNAPRPMRLTSPDMSPSTHITEEAVNHRAPLGLAAVWEAVMEPAGYQCQCSGGLCGSEHSKTGLRCFKTTGHGRLMVAPADLTLSPVAAAAVPAEQLRAWCPSCHTGAMRRQLENKRELERQQAEDPLALF